MEIFKVFLNFRDGRTLEHLVQARHLGEARSLARQAAHAVGAVSYEMEG